VISGPGQVQNTFNADAAVARELNLLEQTNTKVERGNLLTLPLAGGLLYVQPVYVLSENGQQPAFRDVIVYYNGTAAIDKTLTGALSQFPAFSGIAPPPDTGNATQPPPTVGTGTNVDDLLAQASRLSKDAQAALDAKDLGTYQQKVAELSDVLAQVIDARAKETGKSAGSTTSSSSTTTTTRAKTSSTQALGPRG